MAQATVIDFLWVFHVLIIGLILVWMGRLCHLNWNMVNWCGGYRHNLIGGILKIFLFFLYNDLIILYLWTDWLSLVLFFYLGVFFWFGFTSVWRQRLVRFCGWLKGQVLITAVLGVQWEIFTFGYIFALYVFWRWQVGCFRSLLWHRCLIWVDGATQVVDGVNVLVNLLEVLVGK